MKDLESRLRSLGLKVADELATLRPRESDLRRIRVRRRLAAGGASAVILLMAIALLAGTMWVREDPSPFASQSGDARADQSSFVPQSGDARVVSLDPARVHAGDPAQLHVYQAPGTWGLAWTLEHREDTSSPWEEVGLLVIGPGDEWAPHFYLGNEANDVLIRDIGFTGTAVMSLQIPELEPGSYRLGQRFIADQGPTSEERAEWHYAEFEVSL